MSEKRLTWEEFEALPRPRTFEQFAATLGGLLDEVDDLPPENKLDVRAYVMEHRVFSQEGFVGDE